MPQVVGPGPMACLQDVARASCILSSLAASNCIKADFGTLQSAAEALIKVDGIADILLKGSTTLDAATKDALENFRDAAFLAGHHTMKAYRETNPNCLPAFELFQSSWGRLQKPIRDLLPNPRINDRSPGFGRSY